MYRWYLRFIAEYRTFVVTTHRVFILRPTWCPSPTTGTESPPPPMCTAWSRSCRAFADFGCDLPKFPGVAEHGTCWCLPAYRPGLPRQIRRRRADLGPAPVH